MRQYLSVKFRPEDKRSYTYHNDGPPVAEGDMVHLSARGDGWTKGHVIAVNQHRPSFETKGIIGKHIEEEKND